MNDTLKQRLVGALILIALGVVFWPIIFVEQGVKPLGEAAQIPARPSVDTTPIERPDISSVRQSPEIEANKELELAELPPEEAPELVEKAPVTEAIPREKVVAQSTRNEAPPKPAIDADGIPIAWILQVASVSSKEKAEALRSRLVDMGYQAYVKKIKTENSVLLRVYVGPKVERARLESMQNKIDAEFKVHSMIRRYIP
jgi:DedD protein